MRRGIAEFIGEPIQVFEFEKVFVKKTEHVKKNDFRRTVVFENVVWLLIIGTQKITQNLIDTIDKHKIGKSTLRFKV